MDAVAGLFGGDWNNGSNSGSRCSNWNNTFSNSNNNIGARAACDSRFCALPLVTRQADHFSCGQPFIPALANTLRGSLEGGVAFVDWSKLLRKDSVRRARRKLKFLRRQGDEAAIQRFAAAWLGHARWADSHNLIRGMGLDG